MKKLLSIILSVIFIAGSSFAEIVNEIQINGNKRVSDETVKVYGEIKPKGSDFSNSDINNILLESVVRCVLFSVARKFDPNL